MEPIAVELYRDMNTTTESLPNNPCHMVMTTDDHPLSMTQLNLLTSQATQN